VQVFPAVPVVFGHAVFDADDRVLVDPTRQNVGPLGRGESQVLALERIFAFLVELAGGAIQAERDLRACCVTRLVDRFQNHLDRRFVVGHAGSEAAFIAHCRADALVGKNLLQRMEHLGAVAHRLTKARCSHGDDHQFLKIEVVVCVGAAVDDVHHRHRHHHAAGATKVAVERQARFFSRSARHGHAHRQGCVGAQAALVFGAVQIDQRAVQKSLLARVEPEHRFADLGVDVFDCAQHAFAEVARHVTVAQLDRLARAGRCA